MNEPTGPSGNDAERTGVVVSPLFGVLSLEFLVKSELHSCPYLPEKRAREEVFVAQELHEELYHDFMDHGFRRSGNFFYRPSCPRCQECRPLRIPVREFKFSKSQRRVWNKNRDIHVRAGTPRFTTEKFRMYTKYIERQHGSSSFGSVENFQDLMYSSPVQTVEFEYSLDGRILALSVADVSSRSLSSVYAYYDVDWATRSLGTFSALREIHFCRTHDIPYYYLGFYVAACPSMSYKARFRPHEILTPSLTWQCGP
jgi:leucyl-tRNA---protein transferase